MTTSNSIRDRESCFVRCLLMTLISLFILVDKASGQCTDTVKSVLKDSSGIVFTVSETSCDSFGNDAAVTISASEKGSQKLVLIKYGPDERSRPPHIVVNGGKNIVISIDSVAELFRQEIKFGSYVVIYEIGHVEFPHSERDITGKKS